MLSVPYIYASNEFVFILHLYPPLSPAPRNARGDCIKTRDEGARFAAVGVAVKTSISHKTGGEMFKVFPLRNEPLKRRLRRASRGYITTVESVLKHVLQRVDFIYRPFSSWYSTRTHNGYITYYNGIYVYTSCRVKKRGNVSTPSTYETCDWHIRPLFIAEHYSLSSVETPLRFQNI